MLTVVVVAAYLSLGNGPLSTRFRGAIGLDDRMNPVVAATTTGPHAFLDIQSDGEPVGFSPCDPVRYVVNPTGAPRRWRQHVDTAIAEVERRTGLAFDDLGTTDDRDFGRRIDDSGPSPVLIGWADESEVGDLADDVAGVGGPTMVTVGGIKVYVTGSVVLDRDATAKLERTRDGDAMHVALLLHELGHLVGLDHVDDAGELMYPDGIARTGYGPGDLEGLAAVGAGRCT